MQYNHVHLSKDTLNSSDLCYRLITFSHQVYLWFNKPSKPPTPEDLSEPLPYDRLANLKTAFFDIFADHSSEPARLDYVKMVIILCHNIDYFTYNIDASFQGICCAISTVLF